MRAQTSQHHLRRVLTRRGARPSTQEAYRRPDARSSHRAERPQPRAQRMPEHRGPPLCRRPFAAWSALSHGARPERCGIPVRAKRVLADSSIGGALLRSSSSTRTIASDPVGPCTAAGTTAPALRRTRPRDRLDDATHSRARTMRLCHRHGPANAQPLAVGRMEYRIRPSTNPSENRRRRALSLPRQTTDHDKPSTADPRLLTIDLIRRPYPRFRNV